MQTNLLSAVALLLTFVPLSWGSSLPVRFGPFLYREDRAINLAKADRELFAEYGLKETAGAVYEDSLSRWMLVEAYRFDTVEGAMRPTWRHVTGRYEYRLWRPEA